MRLSQEVLTRQQNCRQQIPLIFLRTHAQTWTFWAFIPIKISLPLWCSRKNILTGSLADLILIIDNNEGMGEWLALAISWWFELDFLFAEGANLLLPQPWLQALEMELVLAIKYFGDDLPNFVVPKAYGASLLTWHFDLCFRKGVDQLGGQSFTHHSYFLLQLQQFFVSHLVGVNAMLIFRLKSHRHYQVRYVFSFSRDSVI